MNELFHNLLYAGRRLRADPGSTAVVVLSLALAIGANTALFSFVDAVFLRPLPVARPAELTAMYTTDTAYPDRLLPISYLNFLDDRASGIFAGLTAQVTLQLNIGSLGGNSGGGAPERISAASVTANYFDVLGVAPLAGRTFTPDEEAPVDAHPVIVLSSRLWRRRFAADRGIIGRTIQVNHLRYTVVGVAAEGFRGPSLLSNFDAWIPMAQRQGVVGFLARWFDARQASMCAVYGRLRSPDGLERARAGLQTVSARLAREYPQANHARRAVLIPFAQATLNPNQRGQVVRMGWFLSIMVGLVLALACTNVANLLLSRALARQREIAVRLALGAGRARLVRQLLAESLLLAFIGGGAGLLVALSARSLLWRFKPPSVPDTLDVSFDPRVLLFALALTLATGLLCGLAPALQSSRPDLVAALRGGGAAAEGRRRRRGRNALVVAQVTLSLLLLLGAGLVLRSLQRAQRLDLGFAADHLISLNMDPDGIGYDRPRALALFRRAVERVEALPGVRSAAFAFNQPLAHAPSALFYLDGKTSPSPQDGAPITTNAADLGYFETVGIPLLAGRLPRHADSEDAPPVIVVNRAVADRYLAGENPIGKRMRFVDVPTAFEIVGVVGDATYASLGEPTPCYLYYPFAQAYGAGEVTLYVRTVGPPGPLLAGVRRAVQELDPTLPIYNVATVSDVVAQSLWAPRAAAALLVFFGLLGLVLATVGTYGVMSYLVDQSRREIGIRMALGERRGAILARVLGRAMALVAVGLAIGLAAAFSTTRLIASFLYGLSATDGLTFALAPLLLAAAAVGATIVPARRATAVDPLRALRAE